MSSMLTMRAIRRPSFPSGMPTTEKHVLEDAFGPDGPKRRAAFARIYTRYFSFVRQNLGARGFRQGLPHAGAQDFFCAMIDPDTLAGRRFKRLAEKRGSFRGWLLSWSWFELKNAQRREREHVNLDDCQLVAKRPAVPELPDDVDIKNAVVAAAFERLQSGCSTAHEVAFVEDLRLLLTGGERKWTSARFQEAFRCSANALAQRRRRLIEKAWGCLVAAANTRCHRTDCIEDELRRLAMLSEESE